MGKKSQSKEEPRTPRTIENRRARHDYDFLETHEAGIVLEGAEVKSLWLGRVNLTDAFCKIEGNELWIVSLDIEPYEHASRFQPERRRTRKLLMHRKEIDLLFRKVREKGLTLLPSRLYFKNGRVKVQVALAKGRREYDKRQQIAEKEKRLEIERMRSERGKTF